MVSFSAFRLARTTSNSVTRRSIELKVPQAKTFFGSPSPSAARPGQASISRYFVSFW